MDPRDQFFRSLNQATQQPEARPVDISLPPPQHHAPIYDSCEFCRLPVRPGESHGVIGQDEHGAPKLVCKIQRLELVEREIPGTLPDSALTAR